VDSALKLLRRQPEAPVEAGAREQGCHGKGTPAHPSIGLSIERRRGEEAKPVFALQSPGRVGEGGRQMRASGSAQTLPGQPPGRPSKPGPAPTPGPRGHHDRHRDPHHEPCHRHVHLREPRGPNRSSAAPPPTGSRRRGINVSRALLRLGGDSLAFFMAGGPTGQMLEEAPGGGGRGPAGLETEGWTRENLTVREEDEGDDQYRFTMPRPRGQGRGVESLPGSPGGPGSRAEVPGGQRKPPPGGAVGLLCPGGRNRPGPGQPPHPGHLRRRPEGGPGGRRLPGEAQPPGAGHLTGDIGIGRKKATTKRNRPRRPGSS
jgi:hypothetical protein